MNRFTQTQVFLTLLVSRAACQCTLYPSLAPNYDCLQQSTLTSPPEQNTFGYAGLAWLTGNVCSDSFLPPGKIGEFMGFQFIRDSQPNGLGHTLRSPTTSRSTYLQS